AGRLGDGRVQRRRLAGPGADAATATGAAGRRLLEPPSLHRPWRRLPGVPAASPSRERDSLGPQSLQHSRSPGAGLVLLRQTALSAPPPPQRPPQPPCKRATPWY